MNSAIGLLRIVCLENVSGLMSSRHGDDYRVLHKQLSARGYAWRRPVERKSIRSSSRPRIFVIATRGPIPAGLTAPTATWLHSGSVAKVGKTIENFVWWTSERPGGRQFDIQQAIDDIPFDKNAVTSLIPESHLSKFESSGKEICDGIEKPPAPESRCLKSGATALPGA